MTVTLLVIAALWLTGAALTYRWMVRELDRCDAPRQAAGADTEVKQ